MESHRCPELEKVRQTEAFERPFLTQLERNPKLFATLPDAEYARWEPFFDSITSYDPRLIEIFNHKNIHRFIDAIQEKNNRLKDIAKTTCELRDQRRPYRSDDHNQVIWGCGNELAFIENDDYDYRHGQIAQSDLQHRLWTAIPGDAWIIVHHETTEEWMNHFEQHGINATIPPPDTRYGRLTSDAKNPFGIQTPIESPGLYVSPMAKGNLSEGVLIAVHPEELRISHEAARHCTTPECGLFGMNDGLVVGQLPPERVLGKETYNRREKRWEFQPNPAAQQNTSMTSILAGIIMHGQEITWNDCP
jgi:hypothetical protein